MWPLWICVCVYAKSSIQLFPFAKERKSETNGIKRRETIQYKTKRITKPNEFSFSFIWLIFLIKAFRMRLRTVYFFAICKNCVSYWPEPKRAVGLYEMEQYRLFHFIQQMLMLKNGKNHTHKPAHVYTSWSSSLINTRRYIRRCQYAYERNKMAIERLSHGLIGECVKNVTYKWNMHIWMIFFPCCVFTAVLPFVFSRSHSVLLYLFRWFLCVCVSAHWSMVIISKPGLPSRTACALFMLVQMRARLFFIFLAGFIACHQSERDRL